MCIWRYVTYSVLVTVKPIKTNKLFSKQKKYRTIKVLQNETTSSYKEQVHTNNKFLQTKDVRFWCLYYRSQLEILNMLENA